MLPDRFWFTGPVPDEDLAAFYRWADVYVSLSEHEGFCVPLVEAMAADVPVLAYAAGAVPETLGGAGLLFAPKDLEVAAEMLGMLVYDRPLRARVLAGQRGGWRTSRRTALEAQSDGYAGQIEALVEDRIHRPALRRRDPRRLRISLPPDRRAPRAEAPGRSPDDLRGRLHHVEERLPGRRRPHPRRHRAALRQRQDARHPRLQPLLGVDLHQRAHRETTRWSGCGSRDRGARR